MAKPHRKTSRHKRSVLRILPRHGAFPIGLAAGVLAYLAALVFWPDLSVAIGANAGFAVYLGIVVVELGKLTPEHLRAHADDEAPPVALIMAATLAAVAVSIYSFFAALNQAGTPQIAQIALGVLSVVLGWFVVHTMAALHYAYEYYESPPDGAKPGARSPADVRGGFSWPDGDPPDGVAFLYISYQIGAAIQISDVPVTSNKMRGRILIHTIFSFFYNTILVAAAVNVVLTAASGS